jgi:hypothetical protein
MLLWSAFLAVLATLAVLLLAAQHAEGSSLAQTGGKTNIAPFKAAQTW